MKHSCHSQKTAFHGTAPHALVVNVFGTLSLEEGDGMNVALLAEHSAFTSSQHFNQLQVSVLPTTHCKKKPLLSG